MTKHSSIACLATVCIASFAAVNAVAELYTVQIGAFSTPSEAYMEAARDHGDLYQTQRDSGVTALSIGRFNSAEEAETALAQLGNAYPSAYVRRANPHAQPQESRRQTPPRSASAATAPPESMQTASEASDDDLLLGTLSDDERKHVVYLDGKLHYKQGNDFVPLEQYRAQNATR